MSYTQLPQEQRYQIYALLKTGCSQTKIAETKEVHKSTISREVRRVQGLRGYRPKQAHQKAMKRRNKAKKRISKAEWRIIDDRLKEDWSLEKISYKLKQLYGIQVSHEWISPEACFAIIMSRKTNSKEESFTNTFVALKNTEITQERVTSEVKYPLKHRLKSAQR